MISTIFTYLHYPVFETRISSTAIPFIDAKVVPAGIIASTLQHSTQVQQIAVKLLRLRSRKRQDISKVLAEQRQKTVYKSDYQFQYYARRYWLGHLCRTKTLNPIASRLLTGLIHSGKLSLNDNVVLSQDVVDYCQPIRELLIKLQPSHDGDSIDGLVLLCWAIEQGSIPIIKILLDDSNLDLHKLPDNLQPLKIAVKIAVEADNNDMTDFLLKNYRDRIRYDWSTSPQPSPLEIAFEHGNYDVASMLIESGLVDPNELTSAEPGLTHLMRAAKMLDNLTTTFLFTRVESDVNKRDGNGQSAFYHAIRSGSFLHHFLNAQSVDLNIRDNIGRTPLSFAVCSRSSVEIVRQLLSKKGLDPNLADSDNRTPLHIACLTGNAQIVELLLKDSRVNCNAQDMWGRTALSLATQEENLGCIRNLLWQRRYDNRLVERSELNINLADHDGQMPLHIAALNGNLRIVQELLKMSLILITAKDNTNYTPAMLAWSCGHQEVGLLLNNELATPLNNKQ